jgi:hypothetical protein
MALIKLNNRSSEDNAIHGRRNLIINGAMQVAQRGTSVTGVNTGGYYTVDRFRLANNGSPDELEFTHEQSTDAPTGFSKSLKLTVTTAETTLAADERVRLQQRIEGQNLQHLKYGTSDAEYLTLSFYVKSNVTGTYGIHLDNTDSGRNVCATYTISAANTWEKKTISIAGDTTGSFNNDNTRSLDVCWVLAAGTDYTSGTLATSWEGNTDANHAPSGQANITDTVSNSWQIAGVQLEVGDIATPFEHRPYGEELSLCQRYYQVGRSKVSTYRTYAGNWEESWPIIFSTTMRDTPTMGVVTSHTYSNLNGHNTYYPQKYGFSHFCYIAANGQYTSDFTWDAEAEL